MSNLFRLIRPAAWIAALAIASIAGTVFAQRVTPGAAPAPAPARTAVSTDRGAVIDRVVAVVNDEALTMYDINEQTRVVLLQMKSQKVTPPAADVLEKQLLERLITERALMQYAKESGIRIDDTQVERAIARIAQDNKLSADEFRKAIEKEGLTFTRYRDEVRNEITLQRLREREVEGRVYVSEAEVDLFLSTLNSQSGTDVEYRLAHILVLVPDQATPEQIDARLKKIEEALRQLRSGGEFGQVAASFSDAPDALKGGELGWRQTARLPTVFVEPVRSLKPGQFSGVLRSASGFHVVKLLEVRDRNAPTVVEQTRVRHILIKVNEITSEAEAKIKIDRIRDRIDLGGKFDEQAKLNSEDGSAVKGGELGWISPGDTVPDFEQAVARIKIGELSAPVRTPFGWHLIEVEERRTQDITTERQKEQARQALRQRKSDELFQEWVRQTRDKTYVEIRLDDRGPNGL
ncbi:MAG: peptidylprolyl isomerase [Betaproteobacteria bacterium]